ncbi:MAG: hypothetical protein IIW48_00365 [Clostridia bacterium]|nr:hypothetical protein [Clostridia bacterium]
MNKLANITHKIFYDNKVLMVFSFILAVVIWLAVVILFSPIDTAVINDVPVTIDLTNSVPAQFDLEIFGQSDFTVDVEVSGKRYVVNSSAVSKDSLKVVAQTAYVDSAGKHTLLLKTTKANENDEFEIVSVSEQQIEVYFDVYKEVDFPIEPKVIFDGDLVKEGYIAGEPFLSADKVTVSGPATEINSIKSVFAEIAVDRPLDATKTQAAELKAYNENGGVLHYLGFNYGNSEVTVTQPVYFETEKPTTVEFKNTPLAYIEKPFEYTVSPSSVRAGIQGVDKNSVPEFISIVTVDFSQLKPGKNTITVDADSIPSVYVVDDIESFEVVVDVTDCTQRTFTVPDEAVTFVNAPDGYEVTGLDESVGLVTLVGPADSLDKIQAADISVVVDLTDVDVTAVSQSVAAKLSINNCNDCWVSGSYTVRISNQ